MNKLNSSNAIKNPKKNGIKIKANGIKGLNVSSNVSE